MKLHTRVLTGCALMAALLISSGNLLAQEVPFKASGQKAIYNPATAFTTATGKATHMGRITGSGVAFPSADLGNGLFEWTALNYELTAANGDQILFEGGGLVQFIPIEGNLFYAVWSGEFTVTGGTGRFRNVKPGSAPIEVIAINDPFELDEFGNALPGDTWTYSWELNGTIDKGKKKNKK